MRPVKYILPVNDRVVIEGVAYRVREQTAGGYVFDIDGQPGASREFTFEEIAREVGREGYRRDIQRFDPKRARARLESGVEHLADLSARTRRGIVFRRTWATMFLDLEKKGEAARSDASMTTAVGVIHAKLTVARDQRRGAKTAEYAGRAKNRKTPVNARPSEDGSDGEIPYPCAKTLRRW